MRVSQWLYLGPGILLASLSVLMFTSCQAPEVKKENQKKQTRNKILRDRVLNKALPAKQFSQKGKNWNAVFSPNSQKVAYISSHRSYHKNPQVYYVDTAQKTLAKRLTFHDGINAQVLFNPHGQNIIYSSSTDEIKEDFSQLLGLLEVKAKTVFPHLLPDHDLDSQLEIYSSGFDGQNIERLTFSSGFDSSMSIHPHLQYLVFTRKETLSTNLYRLNLRTKKEEALIVNVAFDMEPQYSPDGQHLAWVRYDENVQNSRLMLSNSKGQQVQSIFSRTASNLSPYWHPTGEHIIFSSDLGHKNHFELYTVNKDGSCLKQLTQGQGDKLYPKFSADGSQVIFTHKKESDLQVFLMDYSPPEKCPESTI